jgi:excisionase family DNA binding protein
MERGGEMKSNVTHDKLLTTKQAAEIIGRGEPRIYQLVQDGLLEAERFPLGKSREAIRIRESVARRYKERITIPESLPAQAA